MSTKTDKLRVLKLPTIRRLPLYLDLLEKHFQKGHTTISSSHLARHMNLEQIVVRKDLSITGIAGKPRIGFDIEELIAAVRTFIQWDTSQEAILVGAGHLGSALSRYTGFEKMGFSIPAAFDVDPEILGTTIGSTKVYPMGEMRHMIAENGWQIAILCVPAKVAQSVADQLVAAGITAIWNFVPVQLQVPDHVVVQQENLSSGLAVLRVKQVKNEARKKVTTLKTSEEEE